jgi:hypothetical protein
MRDLHAAPPLRPRGAQGFQHLAQTYPADARKAMEATWPSLSTATAERMQRAYAKINRRQAESVGGDIVENMARDRLRFAPRDPPTEEGKYKFIM